MTISEAIEWLKYNKNELEQLLETYGAHMSDLNPTIEALNVAISVLEKIEEGVG